MAAVEVTISGVLYDKLNRTQQQVVLVGEGSLTGLGIGGGPMPPGGGSPGVPTHPIYLPQPPVDPGYGYPIGGPPRPTHPIAGVPPGVPTHPIYYPPGSQPHPEHPIALPPDEGTKPPEPVAPPIDWKAVWHPTEGWIVVGVPQFPHPSPSK